MANHPFNLGLRFLLELAAWASMAYWGWVEHSGILRGVWAVLLPVFAMAVWGVFRVPGHPGNASVAVPGAVRLTIEALEFTGAAVLLAAAGQVGLSTALAVIIVGHYLASYDYVLHLLTGIDSH